MTHKIEITKMSEDEFNAIARDYDRRNAVTSPLWDYPLSEIDILCDEDHGKEYALVGDRLHELPADWHYVHVTEFADLEKRCAKACDKAIEDGIIMPTASESIVNTRFFDILREEFTEGEILDIDNSYRFQLDALYFCNNHLKNLGAK